jgi:hypothetical protein
VIIVGKDSLRDKFAMSRHLRKKWLIARIAWENGHVRDVLFYQGAGVAAKDVPQYPQRMGQYGSVI